MHPSWGNTSLCFSTAQSVEKLTVHTTNQTIHNEGGQGNPSSMMNNADGLDEMQPGHLVTSDLSRIFVD